MNDRQIGVIRAFAKNGMSISKTAEKEFLHPNTVRYHLRIIKKKTGLDPCNFFELGKLLTIISEKETKLSIGESCCRKCGKVIGYKVLLEDTNSEKNIILCKDCKQKVLKFVEGKGNG